MRGASSSFGIVTNIEVKTFAAPKSTTVFRYNWDLSAADAAKAAQQFQKFVQGNIPQEIGLELTIEKGSSNGRVSFILVGGWYGPADQFNAVIDPYLANLPPPSEKSVTPGTYIESVENLGSIGRLKTTGIPDSRNAFYAKSLMTPETSPMSISALNAFMNYLGNEGFTANTVRRSKILASLLFMSLQS